MQEMSLDKMLEGLDNIISSRIIAPNWAECWAWVKGSSPRRFEYIVCHEEWFMIAMSENSISSMFCGYAISQKVLSFANRILAPSHLRLGYAAGQLYYFDARSNKHIGRISSFAIAWPCDIPDMPMDNEGSSNNLQE